MNLWRLDCGAQTILVGGDENLAEVFYWGALLPESENLKSIWNITRLDYSGGVLDGVPALSICPEVSKTFNGHPGMRIRGASGKRLYPNFRLNNAKLSKTSFFGAGACHGGHNLMYSHHRVPLGV